MEANSTQETEPETTSDIRRKSNVVEPFLRLQNTATSWSSKSESDLTKLGRGEEKSECCSPSMVSDTHAEGECAASEMQNLSLGGLENRCKSTTQRRSVSARDSLVSEASSDCCSHGVSKSKRRNSSSALLECVTAHTGSSHHHDHTLRKAPPRKKISNPFDVCSEYAVPLLAVKPRNSPATEYGNIVIKDDRIKGKVSSPGNSSVSDDKEIGVINEYSNICHCIGKQKFIEGHYKATYLCGIRVDGKNEGASACEQTSQEVELVKKAKPTDASSLTTKDNRSSQSTDKETISTTKNKYGSLPTPSARASVIHSSEDSASHIYSNLVATDCLVHKDSTLNSEDENPYGNCTCSTVEDMSVEDVHQISHNLRRLSRASSTSSCAARSTGKRTKDSAPARLSEICIRMLIQSVSR